MTLNLKTQLTDSAKMKFAKTREEAHKRTIKVSQKGEVYLIEISSWVFDTPRKRFADTQERMKYIVEDETLHWHACYGEVETEVIYE